MSSTLNALAHGQKIFDEQHARQWIDDGRDMARREPETVFASIDAKHQAEVRGYEVGGTGLKARGHALWQRRDQLEHALAGLSFDPARQAQELAQGRIDLAWAIGLTVLNASLAVFALLGFGPLWLTGLLAFLVLATALPIEEFFTAYEEKATLREGLFLVVATVALGALYWLGVIRGLLLVSLAPADVGPASHAMQVGGTILRHVLGVLALVSELVCGYKLYRVRAQLFSKGARAIRERDRCNAELISVATALKATQVEPDVRRAYRQIGARQFLAARAEAAPSLAGNHLARAALGAFIVLAVLVLLVGLAAWSAAEPAPEHVIVLLDLTASTHSDAFAANVEATGAVLAAVPASSRVMVLGITDDFGHPRVILDHTLPKSAGYLDLQIQVGREALLAQWRTASAGLQPNYRRTDIIGSLSLLPYLCDLTPGHTRLFIFSDLRQSAGINLERVSRVPVETSIARLIKSRSIPKLTGAAVYLLGVDPSGKSPAYFASLREFWIRFFAEAGARVRAFTMHRRVPES